MTRPDEVAPVSDLCNYFLTPTFTLSVPPVYLGYFNIKLIKNLLKLLKISKLLVAVLLERF